MFREGPFIVREIFIIIIIIKGNNVYFCDFMTRKFGERVHNVSLNFQVLFKDLKYGREDLENRNHKNSFSRCCTIKQTKIPYVSNELFAG